MRSLEFALLSLFAKSAPKRTTKRMEICAPEISASNTCVVNNMIKYILFRDGVMVAQAPLERLA